MEDVDFDFTIFQELEPWRVANFFMPNRLNTPSVFEKSELRVSVIDSPINPPLAGYPLVGILLVPINLERDWNFSTKNGLQRLISRYHNLSRLAVIAEKFDDTVRPYSRTPIDIQDEFRARDRLRELLTKVLPAKCTQGIERAKFLRYEDDRIYAVSIYTGSYDEPDEKMVVEIEVQDVEVEVNGDRGIHFRRRMRYKTMPNVIQSQSRLVARLQDVNGEVISNSNLQDLQGREEVIFVVDTSTLVHPPLQAMVSGLSVVASLKKQHEDVKKPTALCIGVGGGVLLSFLKNVLGFRVVGVQKERNVLTAARTYFELQEDSQDLFLLEFGAKLVLEQLTTNDGSPSTLAEMCDPVPKKYDVVILDLNYPDNKRGSGVCSPPRKFLRFEMFENIKKVLHEGGGLIINVIFPDVVFYTELIKIVKNFFGRVYKIPLDKDTEFVLIATSPYDDDMDLAGPSMEGGNNLLEMIKPHVPARYLSSIMEI